MATMPLRRPWLDADRQAVTNLLRLVLGLRQEWTPPVTVLSARQERRGDLTVHRLCAETWPGVAAPAILFDPPGATVPRPFVLLCCGHSPCAKLNPIYQRMAAHLARGGASVLVPDPLGQGERQPMGHRDVFDVFACGTTLQSLITLEAMGWLQWARQQPWVDARATAAIGNSGGGATTMTLCALDHQLACIASSAHPSSQAYTCQKERALCACAVWPGVAGRLEMWEILSCFAPRPLLIFQGMEDSMFPADHFRTVVRQVAMVYGQRGAERCFSGELVPGDHPWDDRRITLVGKFLAKHLGLNPPALAGLSDDPAILTPDNTCYETWPANAATTEQIARDLTMCHRPKARYLWEVFGPCLPPEQTAQVTPSQDTRRILSQLAAFLDGWPS